MPKPFSAPGHSPLHDPDRTWGRWTGDMAEKLIDGANTIPPAVIHAVKKAWESILPSEEEAVRTIRTIEDFFGLVPTMSRYFPPEQSLENIETIRNLTDHTKWIELFRDHPSFLEDNIPVDPLPTDGSPFGPQALLLSLPVEERRKLYGEYVDAFIPAEVQKETWGENFANMNSADKYVAMAAVNGRILTVNQTLGGVLGIEAWNENNREALGVTQASLRSHYEMNNAADPNFISKGIVDDYAKTLSYQRLFGLHHAIATDPAALTPHLASSRFKGALLAGVLTKENLQTMGAGLVERDHELRLSSSNVRENLDYFTEAVKKENKIEAETLRDTFNNLGGAEKLILVGALAYGLMKSSTVRMAAGLLTGAYFFQKMLLKEEDPIKGWSKLADGITGKLKGTTAAAIGPEWTPGYVEDVAGRSDVIVNFLDDYSIAHLERQAIGFGILHDMPLSALSRNFHMEGGGGEFMDLDVDNPAFNRQIGDALDRRGWSRSRFREFFHEDPSNREQVTEAMSYVFFLKAAERAENKPRAERILQLLRKQHPGTSLSLLAYVAHDSENEIEDPIMRAEFEEAHREYVMLVGEGREMAVRDNMTLGEFMMMHEGFEFVPRQTAPVNNVVDNAPPNIPNVQSAPPNVPNVQFAPPNIPSANVQQGVPPTVPGNNNNLPPNIPAARQNAPSVPNVNVPPSVPGANNAPPNVPRGASSSPPIPPQP